MKSSDSGATSCCCRVSSSDGVKVLGGMQRSSFDSHVFVLRWCLERNVRILLLKMLSNLVRILDPSLSISQHWHQTFGVLLHEPVSVSQSVSHHKRTTRIKAAKLLSPYSPPPSSSSMAPQCFPNHKRQRC